MHRGGVSSPSLSDEERYSSVFRPLGLIGNHGRRCNARGQGTLVIPVLIDREPCLTKARKPIIGKASPCDSACLMRTLLSSSHSEGRKSARAGRHWIHQNPCVVLDRLADSPRHFELP